MQSKRLLLVSARLFLLFPCLKLISPLDAQALANHLRRLCLAGASRKAFPSYLNRSTLSASKRTLVSLQSTRKTSRRLMYVCIRICLPFNWSVEQALNQNKRYNDASTSFGCQYSAAAHRVKLTKLYRRLLRRWKGKYVYLLLAITLTVSLVCSLSAQRQLMPSRMLLPNSHLKRRRH